MQSVIHRQLWLREKILVIVVYEKENLGIDNPSA